MDDYSLPGPPQPQSRWDVLNKLIPDYLKYQEPSPMPPPGTPEGKIGPPSGAPTAFDIGAKALPDILSFLSPGAGKIGAAAASKLPAALFLSNPRYMEGGMRGHSILNDNLNEIGKMIVEPSGANLHVHAIGSFNRGNSLGPREIRSLINSIKGTYPEAETISGFRGTGARWGSAAQRNLDKSRDASVRIRPPGARAGPVGTDTGGTIVELK